MPEPDFQAISGGICVSLSNNTVTIDTGGQQITMSVNTFSTVVETLFPAIKDMLGWTLIHR